MEQAPLPPHERTWRHPSELGSDALVDTGSASEHGLGTMLVTGTLALLVVAALVITITPRPSNAPLALSATTMPPATVTVRGADTITTSDVQASVVALADSVRTNRLHAFTGIPTAIASVPAPLASSADTGRPRDEGSAIIPDLDDDVLVMNDAVTYVVPWRDVAGLGDIGDAIVVDQTGAIVARLASGRLVVASDALVDVDTVSVDD